MATIALTRGFVATIDDEDFALISQFVWHAFPSGRCVYARSTRKIGGKQVLMHRMLMQPPVHMMVDHIDGDGTNNSRANLRICTSAQNQHNQRPNRGGKSRFKGVCYRDGKWGAKLKHGAKWHWLGWHKVEEDAARAYDARAAELFGDFACLNFPVRPVTVTTEPSGVVEVRF